MDNSLDFDLKLAVECAQSFSATSGIGCFVSDASGNVLHSVGYSCSSCRLCKLFGRPDDVCISTHIYGMREAERFGGKYVYFCPMGLTSFVSPIVGSEGSSAKVTVGPFLMVEKTDFLAHEVNHLFINSDLNLDKIEEELNNVPVIEPSKVNKLSTLLFMSVGFLNNVSHANKMLEQQQSNGIQSEVTSYILELKQHEKLAPYPFDTEKLLLSAISQKNKKEAGRLLNEIYGHIFFKDGGNLQFAKSRLYELLVMISRTSIDAGANPEISLNLTHNYLQSIYEISDIENLCLWLTEATNSFIDNVFSHTEFKHANVIHSVMQYVYKNYADKISLDEVAERVYLAPAYLSRVFKNETGQTFTNYLNSVRIEKSKELLSHYSLKLSDIALSVGFEDQSYFTKVFKKITGLSPLQYRKKHYNIKA